MALYSAYARRGKGNGGAMKTVRVQLQMKQWEFAKLKELKQKHGCTSYAEVIRRLLDGSIRV